MKMISKSNLLINFITVGFWTFVSRIFGFVRDIMFAAFLGSGPIGEAFIIAFSLPNIFRRFFAKEPLMLHLFQCLKKVWVIKNSQLNLLITPCL